MSIFLVLNFSQMLMQGLIVICMIITLILIMIIALITIVVQFYCNISFERSFIDTNAELYTRLLQVLQNG